MMLNDNNIKSILRNKLQQADAYSSSSPLYHEFLSIEKKAYESWVPLLGHDRGSHSGPNHLKGVEEQICSLIEQVKDIDITPIECFILLSAIIFHDLGKVVDEKTIKENESSFAFKLAGEQNHHALISAMFLSANYLEFGFSDKGIIETGS